MKSMCRRFLVRAASARFRIFPRWRADGKEIFYAAPNGKVMAAEVSNKGATIEAVVVRPLGVMVNLNPKCALPDVSADGQRFLVATPVE
jgi:hypothetical protein